LRVAGVKNFRRDWQEAFRVSISSSSATEDDFSKGFMTYLIVLTLSNSTVPIQKLQKKDASRACSLIKSLRTTIVVE
jgi:hypothetical protein